MTYRNSVKPFNEVYVKERCGVELPGTEQWLMYSRCKKREYRIFVSKPAEEPPPSGFPVIYLLDANAVFCTMAEAVRIQSRKPAKTGVVPAVIVGIGYCGDIPFNPARYYDFTLPVPLWELPPSSDGSPWPKQGGADVFLNFIEEELKPKIEKKIRIDLSRQTILGHSLGGLFVLHALFTNPSSFSTYVAGSPSIHWNMRAITDEEQKFAFQLKGKKCNINLMIAVGEQEKNQFSVANLNENARELSRRLSNLENCGLQVEFHEFEGENHASVIPVLINRALRFALKPCDLMLKV